MATYANDLRLKEIATGDEDGTWGTSTNTNLSLIGEALSYDTQDCFATDANNTTTVADGAADPARAMYFKVTSSVGGGLTTTRELTIGPNTVSRVMYVENATTGSQSITVKQGSGATVTISNGATKLLYLDGAGAGAAVIDISAKLALDGGAIGGSSAGAGTFTTLNATGGGALTGTWTDLGSVTTVDINGGTIDGATVGANSASTGNFTTLSISGTAITSTAAELNILDGVTATATELNYNDITTLGTSEASKAVTADANGVVKFDNGTIEEYTAVTSTSNATTVNCRDGDNFAHTLTEATTFTFSNPASSGDVSAFTLKVVQDAGASGYSITWPASVDWPSATAPTLTATASAVDYFVFITHDGGTTWYGFTAGQAMG